MRGKAAIVVTGLVVGALAIILMVAGNPANMGVCIACFLRDIAGGLGLHQAAKVQYIRPEILGIVLGAFLTALATREFKVLGGASALTRFVLGFAAMIGFLIFLGCPLRMVIRLAAGDLNALVGFVGLAAGIALGVFFIGRGFTLGRARAQAPSNGYVFPLLVAGLLVLFLAVPSLFFLSKEGPGAQHAPLLLSLAAGLLVGALAQRSRLCFVGGIRDFLMFRDTYLLTGMITIFLTALVGMLIIGKFHLGFTGQPIAHNDGLYNFLGMALAGLASTLLGGCPLRQLVSAAEGNTDSAITVLGLIAGAAFAHNFKIAAGPTGVPVAGQYTVFIALAAVLIIAFGFSVVKASVQGRVAGEQASR
ncbi:MAG: YedE family putative selenium transporter [Thermoanaerobacterales bacterium]|nr:YedE family putative selenium transporter [Bacillota bacterium]MDI6906056.1 YedE family putative selenium transporter [Thermoanaerobacterales bacterium]